MVLLRTFYIQTLINLDNPKLRVCWDAPSFQESCSLGLGYTDFVYFHIRCSRNSFFCNVLSIAYFFQGWEFAHRVSERIAHFFAKNEQMSDSLKKMSDLRLCSFFVSDLSDSLIAAHFWWSTWVIRSHHSFLVSDLSDSLKLLTKNEGMSKSLNFLNKKHYIKHTKK